MGEVIARDVRLMREVAIEAAGDAGQGRRSVVVVSNWWLNHCGPESSEYFGNPRYRHARRCAFPVSELLGGQTREKVEPGPLPVGRTIGYALGIVWDKRAAPLNQDWKSVFACGRFRGFRRGSERDGSWAGSCNGGADCGNCRSGQHSAVDLKPEKPLWGRNPAC
jgi:hypothetical protein